jgi:hypothetical protein
VDRWERRAEKLEAKRRRMRVEGRGLLTTEPLALMRRLKKAGKAAGRPRRKR